MQQPPQMLRQRSELTRLPRPSADAELWDALGHVALKDVVAGLAEGLSARVAENGARTGPGGGVSGPLMLGAAAGECSLHAMSADDTAAAP